jgi:hypothetical protein
MGRWLLGLSTTCMRIRLLKQEDLAEVTKLMSELFNKRYHVNIDNNILYDPSRSVLENYKNMTDNYKLMKKEHESYNLKAPASAYDIYEENYRYLHYYAKHLKRVKHKIQLLSYKQPDSCICHTCRTPLSPFDFVKA